MGNPVGHNGPGRGAKADQLVGQEAANGHEGAQNKPAQQGRLQAFDGPQQGCARTAADGQIARLRILERIGQFGAGVMGAMRAVVDRVGNPQRQRRRANRLVEPVVTGRMAVDRLML